jgi:signal transduction histidine kinase
VRDLETGAGLDVKRIGANGLYPQREPAEFLASRANAARLLCGGIHHEFANLQMMIQELALTLEEEGATGSLPRGCLSELSEATLGVFDLLRTLRKLTADVEATALLPIDLGELIRDLELPLRAGVARGRSLELDLPDTPCPVRGDATQLEHALLGLVDAAFQTEEGRHVGVRLALRRAPESGEIVLRVGHPATRKNRDVRGRGRGSEAERRIELHFSIDLVASIARRHGGSVQVERDSGDHRHSAQLLRLPMDATSPLYPSR